MNNVILLYFENILIKIPRVRSSSTANFFFDIVYREPKSMAKIKIESIQLTTRKKKGLLNTRMPKVFKILFCLQHFCTEVGV